MIHGSRRCFVCGAEQAGPLPYPASPGDGVCRSVRCQHEMHLRLREHLATLAVARRTRIEAAIGRGSPVVLLPSNRWTTSRLPAGRRAAFAAHLDALCADAVDGSGSLTPTERELLPILSLTPHEAGLVAQGCATCRGACCQKGGTTAWLTADAIRRALVTTGLDVNDLRAQYLRDLPTRSYRESCVYHTPRGCALSPALRADTCHAFLCDGAHALVSLVRRERPQAVRLVATEGSGVVSVRTAAVAASDVIGASTDGPAAGSLSVN